LSTSSGNGPQILQRHTHRSAEEIEKIAERTLEGAQDPQAQKFRTFIKDLMDDPDVREKIRERIERDLKGSSTSIAFTVACLKIAADVDGSAPRIGALHLHSHLNEYTKEELETFATTGKRPVRLLAKP